MVFLPNFSDFSSWIQIFWKKTRINLVSKYFRIYLTEQVGSRFIFYQSQKRKKRNDGAARNPPHFLKKQKFKTKIILIKNPGTNHGVPTGSQTLHHWRQTRPVCNWKSYHCHCSVLFCKSMGNTAVFVVLPLVAALIDTVGSTKKKSWLRPWFPFSLRQCFMSNLHTHVVFKGPFKYYVSTGLSGFRNWPFLFT